MATPFAFQDKFSILEFHILGFALAKALALAGVRPIDCMFNAQAARSKAAEIDNIELLDLTNKEGWIDIEHKENNDREDQEDEVFVLQDGIEESGHGKVSRMYLFKTFGVAGLFPETR